MIKGIKSLKIGNLLSLLVITTVAWRAAHLVYGEFKIIPLGSPGELPLFVGTFQL